MSDTKFLLWAKNDFLYSFQVAEALALKGEKEEALNWLEKPIYRGSFNYPFLKEYDPFLKNLREDERFKSLLHRVQTDWNNFRW